MKEADSLIERAMKYLKSAKILLDTLVDLTAAMNKVPADNGFHTHPTEAHRRLHLQSKY